MNRCAYFVIFFNELMLNKWQKASKEGKVPIYILITIGSKTKLDE